jgi:hypothetical protein
MPFQFFFTAALFFAYDYFILNNKKRGWLLLGAVLAAIATHKLSLMLAPILLLALGLGRTRQLLTERSFWLSLCLCAGVSYLLLFFAPHSAYRASVAIPLRVGAFPDKLAYVKTFVQFVPFGLSFLVLALPFVFDPRHSRLRFYFLAFVLGLFMVSLLAPENNPRYMCHLFPVGIVVASGVITLWSEAAVRFVKDRSIRSSAHRSILSLLFVSLVVCTFFTVDVNHLLASVGRSTHFYDQGPANRYILDRLQPGDLIVSVEPSINFLYLNRSVDYFLREKPDLQKQEYVPFSDQELQNMSGSMIDSPEKMRKLLVNNRHRIWLYANKKIAFMISVEMDSLVRENFRPVYTRGQTYVLVKDAVH